MITVTHTNPIASPTISGEEAEMEITTNYSGLSGTLTTDHARSSYGLPVLVVDGAAHGPSDLLPRWPEMPMTAGEYIYKWAMGEGQETRDFADRFCGQWPDGPQVLIHA